MPAPSDLAGAPPLRVADDKEANSDSDGKITIGVVDGKVANSGYTFAAFPTCRNEICRIEM